MINYSRLKERGARFMEQKVEQAYLYDFYGELLNKRQQGIYEDFIFRDFSFSEIAENEGISRQGAYDMVKRCTNILEGYESKLHLVQKFLDTKKRVEKIHALTKAVHLNKEETHPGQMDQVLDQINQISSAILESM